MSGDSTIFLLSEMNGKTATSLFKEAPRVPGGVWMQGTTLRRPLLDPREDYAGMTFAVAS
jgi:hypothetical protein